MEAQKLTYNLKVVPKYFSSITTDHLGSICQLIKPNGAVVEKTNYDPWGRVRNADTWTYPTSESVAQSDALTTTYRGYTAHEHLPHFALINMNCRIYDPVVGRMLSPDNYVQDPNNPQNYNRYSYVLNNPLKYTDPSGEFWHLVIGVAIGGTLNVVMNWNNIDSFGQGALYFGVGAVAGALSAGIGAVAAAGATGVNAAMMSGMMAGMVGGGINNGGMTALAGGSFDDVLGSAIQGSVIGGFAGLAGGAAFYGSSQYFDKSIFNNTLSYAAGSSA